MMLKLDLRSVVAGAVISLVAVTFFGADDAPKAEVSSKGEVGRFQLRVAAIHVNVDAFVIDTVTGKVWAKGLNVNERDTDFFKTKIRTEGIPK